MFAGFGTLVNVIAIVVGGILGILFGKFLSQKIQETIELSCGVAVIFIGAGGTLSKMLFVNSDGYLEMTGTLMMIVSLAIGGLIGEVIDIDDKVEQFGKFLRRKSGNEGDSKFIDGFITSSLTVCIGAMAVIGAIEDRLLGNFSILYAKSLLDFLIVLVFASSMGKGAIFSAISVGIFQGSITLAAGFLQPIMNSTALDNLSYVGNVLIFCIGINLFFGKKIRVANLLPSLIISVAWR